MGVEKVIPFIDLNSVPASIVTKEDKNVNGSMLKYLNGKTQIFKHSYQRG